MALISLPRMFNNDFKRSCVLLGSVNKFSKIPSASIISKEFKDPNVKKPAPWPYKEKKFTYLRGFFEGTLKRFDENTKVIVVEGNIGVGKSAFAQHLADAFDMLYIPEPDFVKSYCITHYGYDIRKLNHLFPPTYKIIDLAAYYTNPFHPNVATFQFRMYTHKYLAYIEALAHLLNTGQGVVLDRSVFSDLVFMETMHKFGYVSKPARDLYMDFYNNCMPELLRPHLVIYLDIPPEVALERIKQRNQPDEANSKVLTKEYLETIEYFYKQHYLKKMEEHAELLIYDWSNYGDVEVVVEDIERIDFDVYNKYDLKLNDWRMEDDYEWNHYRRLYTNNKNKLLRHGHSIWRPSVTELFHPGEEVLEFRNLLSRLPGELYSEGFNPAAGDKVLFKTEHKSYWYPRIRRIFDP